MPIPPPVQFGPGSLGHAEYVMFADEAGDFGFPPSGTPGDGPTSLFVVTGFVVRKRDLHQFDRQLINLRNDWAFRGLVPVNREMHTREWLTTIELEGMPDIQTRNRLVKEAVNKINGAPVRLLSVAVDKEALRPQDFDPFVCAWKVLLDVLDHYTQAPTLVVCDEGHEKRMRKLMGPNGGINLGYVDPTPQFLDSKQSDYIQTADLAATLLYQMDLPSPLVRQYHADQIFPQFGKLCPFAGNGQPPQVLRP